MCLLLHYFHSFKNFASSFYLFETTFRPHCLHIVCRCGLLLQMSHVAWSVCLSFDFWHMGELCINGQTNQDTVCEADCCGSSKPCIRWGQDQMNPLAIMGDDRRVMWPLAKLLWTFLLQFVLIASHMPLVEMCSIVNFLGDVGQQDYQSHYV